MMSARRPSVNGESFISIHFADLPAKATHGDNIACINNGNTVTNHYDTKKSQKNLANDYWALLTRPMANVFVTWHSQ